MPVCIGGKEEGNKTDGVTIESYPKYHPKNGEDFLIHILAGDVPVAHSGQDHKTVVKSSYINLKIFFLIKAMGDDPSGGIEAVLKPNEYKYTRGNMEHLENKQTK